jgi:hypothetical protein
MTLPNEHEPDATSGKRRKGDYVVGKYRPPVHTRWQPGQSGNPNGRRKGRRNVKTELKEMYLRRLRSATAKQKKRSRCLQLTFLLMGSRALKGMLAHRRYL